MKLDFIYTVSTKCKLAVLFPSLCTHIIIHKEKCLEGLNININKTHLSCMYRHTGICLFLCVCVCVCVERERGREGGRERKRKQSRLCF